MSEEDLLEMLHEVPCPEKWNSGDLNSALLAGWGEMVREMVNLFRGHDEVLCGKILSYLLYDDSGAEFQPLKLQLYHSFINTS